MSTGENTFDKKALAQIVVDVGFITAEQLEAALQLQRTSGEPLDQVLTAQGLISPEGPGHGAKPPLKRAIGRPGPAQDSTGGTRS